MDTNFFDGVSPLVEAVLHLEDLSKASLANLVFLEEQAFISVLL